MPKARFVLLLIAGCLVFLIGSGWGLPSRQADAFLFGSREPWSGRDIVKLAGDAQSDDQRAADVSSNPLDRRERAVLANATDRDRSRIVRRYRLMSYQPDEFTTFAALSRMKPGRGDLDPRMYKYGGLWIYPVGALLKVASAFGLVRLTPDPAYYLDHPEAFGRFYVVARLYSAIWGLLGIVAVFLLVRRICGGIGAATCAASCFILMPVVVTGVHEAKPHLAGMTLALWAVLAAAGYVERGNRKAAVAAALLCGAAVGMVPSALPSLLVLPAMALFRRRENNKATDLRHHPKFEFLRSSMALVSIAGLIYCITNPYVLFNLLRNRGVLLSNLGNSSDFYQVSLSGLPRAAAMVGLGTSFLLSIVGAGGAIALAIRAARTPLNSPDEFRRRATGVLLATATLPTALAFIIFAAGQPADYARFALPFDVFLAIEAVVAIETFVPRRQWRRICFVLLVMTTGFFGLQYLAGFERDCGQRTSRTVTAAELAQLLPKGNGLLASREEPAPWSLPPVDLFRWKIVLPPRHWPKDRAFDDAAVTIGPTDFFQQPSIGQVFLFTPISWAHKLFSVESSSGKRVGP